jgi:predicted  nucleic acid-binding Zn-ribbon protein
VNARVPDEDWVSARVEKARHEREIALAAARRLEDEVKRLTYRVAELESGRVALRNRAQEAEAYVAAVKASLPWRVIQSLRGFVSRKW